MTQQLRYNDTELSLIKAVFLDKEPLLKALRKIMLQYPLSKEEKGLINGLNSDTIKIIRKTFLPEIEVDAPLHQVGDMWSWLNINILDKTPEQIQYYFKSREILTKYINQQLEILERNTKIEKIKFKDFINSDDNYEEMYINILTRNTIIGHTELMLQQLVTLAGIKNETIEETKERLEKNSSK